jgi:hypothetical protein
MLALPLLHQSGYLQNQAGGEGPSGKWREIELTIGKDHLPMPIWLFRAINSSVLNLGIVKE